MRAREFLMKDAYSFHADDASPGRDLRGRCTQPTRASSPAAGSTSARCRPTPAASAATPPTSSMSWPTPARTPSPSPPTRRLCRQRRTGRGPGPGRRGRRHPTEEARLVDTPRPRTIADLVDAVRPADRAHRQDPGGRRRGGRPGRPGRAPGARRPRAQRGQGRQAPAGRRPAAHGRARRRSAPPSAPAPARWAPKDLPLPCIVDRAVAVAADFSAGANQDGKHWFGLNWGRDLPLPEVADLRNVVDGDPSPDGRGTLTIARGIEVGHIFQLGRKYSDAMKATVLGEDGRAADHDHGLLRHRRLPRGGRRHRAAPRRARHLLARPHRPLRRSPCCR